MNSNCFSFGLLVAGLLLCTTRDAAAYVDPGSGSYLFQILIAGLTATAFFFTSIKQKLGQLFRSGSAKQDSNNVAASKASATREL